MRHRLNPTSHGVASHVPHRTQLRVPNRYRKSGNLKQIDIALKSVPGVKEVVVNPKTGSILVHHEEHAEILDRLTKALDDTAPELLLALVEPEVAVPELLATFFHSLVSGEQGPKEAAHAQEMDSHPEDHMGVLVGSGKVKQLIPIAFLGAGIFKMLENQSLLGATAPLVLFYYAFDTYWKLQQENATWRLAQNMDQDRQQSPLDAKSATPAIQTSKTSPS